MNAPRPCTRLVPALIALFVTAASALPPLAASAPMAYVAHFTGAGSVPPNASPGVGTAQLDLDPVAHTMRVRVTFSSLLGTVVAAHVHAPTTVPGSGTTNAATVVPSLTGFPTGVTSGNYDWTYDMTDPASYNPDFLNDHGDDPGLAEAALFQAIAEYRAYFNLHTTSYPGGELKGFFAPAPTPVRSSTWAAIKSLYR